MLQIKITVNNNYSVAEQAQMAIEAGCTWLRLDLPESDDAEIREQTTDLISLCRESGVILTIERRATLARELGIHGVFVDVDHNAIAVRNELGPEAIVGTVVASASAAVTMSKADVDFVQLPQKLSLEEAAKIIAETRAAECDIPFVAQISSKNFTADFVSNAANAGFAGFVVGGEVFNFADPIAEIERLLSIVRKV